MTPEDQWIESVAQAALAGIDRRALARSAGLGARTRVRQGVYADTDVWDQLPEHEKAKLRIHAVALVSAEPPVFSHWSAAALLGLPSGLTREPRIHRSVDVGGAPNQPGVATHLMPVPIEDRVAIDGLQATGVARTVVDIAASASFMDAVIVADAGLRMLGAGAEQGRAMLHAAWQRAQPRRAHRKVERVVEFADPLAQTPIESASRVSMHQLRLPVPVLQHRFHDRNGFVAQTDFFFPDEDAVGEADGRWKYTDPEFTGGDPGRVVYDEKRREDRLRAIRLKMARWGSREASSPQRLAPVLAAVGVRPRY